MSDISKEIQSFKEAIYGEEVRKALISLAEKVNDESTAAKKVAEDAMPDIQAAIQAAETATDVASKAARRANAAAEAVEGVIDDRRLKAVENKVTEIIETLSNVLGVS